jgi:hypothetical protein
VGIFFIEPRKGGLEKRVKRTEIGVGFCEVLDGLGEVGGGKKARIRLAESSVGFPKAGFFEMVQVPSAGAVPRNLAFVKKIEVPFEWISGFGGTTGEGTNDPVLAGEPDGEEAGLPLAAKMKQNPLILNRLAHGGTLAEEGQGVKRGR